MTKQSYFDLTLVKRYFHLITFKPEKKYTFSSMLTDLEASVKKNVFYSTILNFNVVEAEIISNMPFFGGEEDFSVLQNGQPPYKYEILLVNMPDLNMFTIGFPFKLLAKLSLDKLINSYKLLSFGSFIKCDVNNLLIKNYKNDLSYDNFLAYFSGLDLIFPGETKINSVNLDGEKPLESPLFIDVFKDQLNDKKCHLERCSIKCRLQFPKDGIPKTQANFHIDMFGNYKFYLHGSGKNIFVVPFLFSLLFEKGCLHSTLNNPINRLKDV